MRRVGLTRRSVSFMVPFLSLRTFLLSRSAFARGMSTPETTDGPYYPRKISNDYDNDLAKIKGSGREAAGEMLYLTGRVLNLAGQPLADARVEIWQCDGNGVYHHIDDRSYALRDKAFQGFGYVMADQMGRFSFRTIVPVPYPGRTPHIHIKVYDNNRARLTTQLYLEGHRQNELDFLFHILTLAERRQVEMRLTPAVNGERKAFRTAIELVVSS